MTNTMSWLPKAEVVGASAVGILAIIVAWDAFWLTRQRRDVPELGFLQNDIFAWESEPNQELFRQWANLATLAAMMVLPYALLDASGTPIIYAIVWDILLCLHVFSLLVPKRYAVTKTHLFADGQRYEWDRLRLQQRQPKSRILLHRRGWGPFAPLPLGGTYHDLELAKVAIQGILGPEQSHEEQ